MKKYIYVFIICNIFFIVCSKLALAAPPRFFEPEKVAYKSVYYDFYRTTGLWKMKNRGLNGYACVFQNEDDDTYNTGAREQGELVYGPFEIPDEPDVYLSFWYLWEVEASLNYDKMSVEISSNDPDGPYTILRDNRSIREHHPKNEWACMKWIDLSAYRGETVYIRFYFDTVDAILNNYRGWLIDIITIYRNHFASIFKPQWILDISLDEFDQSNGTARDYSGHNHHGTIQDPSYRSTLFNHEVNGSLRINENNKIVVSDSPEFGALRSLAIDFWFYPEDKGKYPKRVLWLYYRWFSTPMSACDASCKFCD